MVHGAMLALADDRSAGKNDREHGYVIDDAHDAGEPGGRDIRVEGDADVEIDRRERRALGCETKSLISVRMICWI